PGLRSDGCTNEDPRCGKPPGLRSDGCMKVIACKHATQLPVPSGPRTGRRTARAGPSLRKAGAATQPGPAYPESHKCWGACSKGDPTHSEETPDDRGAARRAPRSPE